MICAVTPFTSSTSVGMAGKTPSSDADAEEGDYIEEVEYEEVEITDEEDIDENTPQGVAVEANPAEHSSSADTSTAAPDAAATSQTAAAALRDLEAGSAAGADAGAAASTAAAVDRAAGSQGDALTVDQQASKMAFEVAHLASEVAHKLQGGLLQAFTGANITTSSSSSTSSSSKLPTDDNSTPTAAAAAAATKAAAAAAAAAAAGFGSKLSSGLTGLGSWWQNIDQSLASTNTPLTAQDSKPENKLKQSVTPESQIVQVFSLDPSEALVDSYSCDLVQTFSCSHNTLTPPMQITFDGKMYITDKHTCFQAIQDQPEVARSSSGGGSSTSGPAKQRRTTPPPLVFKIAHSDVASATREPSPCPKGKSLAAADVLRIVVKPSSSSSSSSSGVVRKGSMDSSEPAASQWSVSFRGFDPPGGLDGALALIEHLREG